MKVYNGTNGILCNGISKICNQPYVAGFEVSFAIVCVLINIAHIGLLKRTARETTPLLWIFINIGVADVVHGIVFALSISCQVHYALYSHQKPVVYMYLLECAVETVIAGRYFVIMISSIERYYAVCLPFSYDTSFIVRHIGKGQGLCWLITFITFAVGRASISPVLCLNDILGPRVDLDQFDGGSSKVFSAGSVLLMLTPTMINIILLIKIERELKQMALRTQGENDKDLRKASRYILFNSLLFYLSVFPTVAAIGMRNWTNISPRDKDLILWTLLIAQSCYGIGNVFLYVYMYPSYVKQVTKIFRCSTKVSVQSEVETN